LKKPKYYVSLRIATEQDPTGWDLNNFHAAVQNDEAEIVSEEQWESMPQQDVPERRPVGECVCTRCGGMGWSDSTECRTCMGMGKVVDL
jgi:hypothetical protein